MTYEEMTLEQKTKFFKRACVNCKYRKIVTEYVYYETFEVYIPQFHDECSLGEPCFDESKEWTVNDCKSFEYR